MEIKRDLYLNRLIKAKGNGLVKVITGIRRCGKSYLMNTLFYNSLKEEGIEESRIIRFAFDSADDLKLIGENLLTLRRTNRKVDPDKFISYINNRIDGKDTHYLLLDEIQLLGNFEAVLNGYLRKSNLDIYVSGSNARFLSKDVISEFAGRGFEIHLSPLSFSEFMQVYSGDKYEGLAWYMLYGGLPLVVLNPDEETKMKLLDSLFDEIYITDIVKRNRIRNQSDLEDLLRFLSSSVGSLTNPDKLRNTFRSVKKSDITSKTIRKYISYVEDAFIISKSTRYDIRGKAYIDSTCKYYFSDPGLRNARIGFRQFEETHLMENVIYNELVCRGYNVDVGIVPVSEKNPDGGSIRKQLEVDFVCNRGSSRVYIQSAMTIPDESKRAQETRPFGKIKDSFPKVIITKDIVPMFRDENGVLTINIYDFLLKPELLPY